MIRFKVIRASHLLLGVAIVLLVAMLALLGARLLARRHTPPAYSSARLVDAQSNDEAKTAQQVFASSRLAVGPRLSSAGLQIEVVRPTAGPAPRVLIYHTHTHEAYEQVAEDPYKALEAWRTADADHSVVKVGRALAQQLRACGFEVVHDVTDHEGQALSTAYTRSLQTLEGYAQTFDLYIDLHRDAYVEGEPVAVTSPQGEQMAPLMMLIGNGVGFEVKPWYAQNYAFACALKERLDAIAPGLCKPVLVKDGRYNQHIGVFSILVEVGHNRNTLSQALNSVAPLARALHSLMIASPEARLTRMRAAWMLSQTSRDSSNSLLFQPKNG